MVDNDGPDEHSKATIPPPASGDVYQAETAVREAPPELMEAIRSAANKRAAGPVAAGSRPEPAPPKVAVAPTPAKEPVKLQWDDDDSSLALTGVVAPRDADEMHRQDAAMAARGASTAPPANLPSSATKPPVPMNASLPPAPEAPVIQAALTATAPPAAPVVAKVGPSKVLAAAPAAPGFRLALAILLFAVLVCAGIMFWFDSMTLR